MTRLTVESVGVLALLEDHGRSGLAHLGVGRSGAADRASYDLANRLVGNRPGAACIEVTLGRLAFTVDATVSVAVTGAPVAIRCGNRAHAVNASFRARAGDTVTLAAPTAGLRTYVAVRGGISGQEVLGSVSWDTMAQLGTPPLRAGDVLQVSHAMTDWPATDVAPVATIGTGPLELPLLLGPRDDWFTDEALDRLANRRVHRELRRQSRRHQTRRPGPTAAPLRGTRQRGCRARRPAGADAREGPRCSWRTDRSPVGIRSSEWCRSRV